jgi:putative hydrolase of the HAD superfamily
MPSTVKAVVLDVGGVLFTPHPDPVLRALRERGAEPADGDDAAHHIDAAHYAGVRAIDALEGAHHDGEPASFAAYFGAFVDRLGVPADRHAAAITALNELWVDPACDLWIRPTPGSTSALRRLADADIPLAIVSNSDGTVEGHLSRAEVCQVGAGAGVEVRAIVDSSVVGVAKPDPRIFTYALEALSVAPAEALYVGDTVRYDVNGARAAGLTPLHLDPYGLCPDDDHLHGTSLERIVAWVVDA